MKTNLLRAKVDELMVLMDALETQLATARTTATAPTLWTACRQPVLLRSARTLLRHR